MLPQLCPSSDFRALGTYPGLSLLPLSPWTQISVSGGPVRVVGLSPSADWLRWERWCRAVQPWGGPRPAHPKEGALSEVHLSP